MSRTYTSRCKNIIIGFSKIIDSLYDNLFFISYNSSTLPTGLYMGLSASFLFSLGTWFYITVQYNKNPYSYALLWVINAPRLVKYAIKKKTYKWGNSLNFCRYGSYKGSKYAWVGGYFHFRVAHPCPPDRRKTLFKAPVSNNTPVVHAGPKVKFDHESSGLKKTSTNK